MRKICFFNTAQAWGGGEKWHFDVSHHLHTQGHQVLVIAHSQGILLQKLLQANIPCQGITLNNLSFLNPIQHQKIIAILKKGAFETIIMNLPRDVKIAGPCAQKAQVERIIYRRGSAIPIKNTCLNRYYFKNSITEVLANSQATKKTIRANNPNLFSEEKITVIYNGIATNQLLSQYPSAPSSPKKEFILLTLGRLEQQKNHVFLLHLAKIIKTQNLPYKIVIGGAGRLQSQLETLIRQLDVADVVSLKGFITNTIDFITQADIFVLPSLWEGFGYVLAEAALCQKPTIAFNLSSNPELVIHEKTGYLVPVNDTKVFLDKVNHLYKHPNKRREMGRAAAARTRLHFDQKQQLQKLENYLVG